MPSQVVVSGPMPSRFMAIEAEVEAEAEAAATSIT